MTTFLTLNRPHALALLTLIAAMLIAFLIRKAVKYRRGAQNTSQHNHDCPLRTGCAKLFGKLLSCWISDSDDDDLYTPSDDSAIWWDDDDEYDDDEDSGDDRAQLGVDNLFPFRRHLHR